MENKELMTTYAKAVNYGFQEYGFSVKLPEELTFKEFKTGWDQDDYIHDSSLFRSLADGACYEYGYKIGNYIPGTKIPILSENILKKKKPEYLILFSWHIANELKLNLRKKGFKGKFIIPLPKPRIEN